MMKRICAGIALTIFTSAALGMTMSLEIDSTSNGYDSYGTWVPQAIEQITTFKIDLSVAPYAGGAPYQTLYQGGVTFSSSGFGDYSGKNPQAFSPVSGSDYFTLPGSGEVTSLGSYADGGIVEVNVLAYGPDGDPADVGAKVTGLGIWNFWNSVKANPVDFHAVSSHCFTSDASQVCIPQEYDDPVARIVGLSLDGASIGAVPEPATWALASSGLGLLAFGRLGRRRRQVARVG